MVKDLEKEEIKKEEAEQKHEEHVTWFQKVPPIWKIGGVAVLFLKYQDISNRHGQLSEMWLWVGTVLLIWYFLGSATKKAENKILTPEEAERELRKEIERRRKNGRIPQFARVYITENDGLFHHEGMPQHYQIGIEIIEDNIRKYKRAIVNAEGDTKGYVTIQDNVGSLTGREPIPKVTPKWIDDAMKKYNMDWKDILIAGGRRK